MSDTTSPARFVLLPFSKSLRREYQAIAPTLWLEVFPVLLMHAGESTGWKCWPSQDRIAALAGIRKAKVREAVDSLRRSGWIDCEPYGRTTMYTIKGRWNGDNLNSRDVFSIGIDLMENGLWAAMSPATKRVYATMKAHCWHAVHFLGGEYFEDRGWAGYTREDVIAPIPWARISLMDCDFLSSSVYNPTQFSIKAGMDSKTWRRAICWLTDHKLIYFAESEESGESGYIMPRTTGGFAVVGFHEKIAAIKERMAEHAISTGTKASNTAAEKRQ